MSPGTLFRQSRPPTLPTSFNLADFSELVKIGRGSQGAAYRCHFLGLGLGGAGSGLLAGMDVCVKVCEDRAAGRRELAAMDGLPPHPNVIRCFGSFDTRTAFYLVLELGKADLKATLKQPLTVAQRLDLLRGTAEGLAHLHAHDVVHCDVKAENVVVGFDGRAKVCDLGLARPGGGTPPSECVGTTDNMAPEVVDAQAVLGERYSSWQLGLLMVKVMWGTDRDLFVAPDPEWNFRMIGAIDYDLPADHGQMPEAMDGELRCLLTDHIFQYAEDRWTVAQLLGHHFFASATW
jgi:serine/threonine protein kinase